LHEFLHLNTGLHDFESFINRHGSKVNLSLRALNISNTLPAKEFSYIERVVVKRKTIMGGTRHDFKGLTSD
jgi:hypothetical protein